MKFSLVLALPLLFVASHAGEEIAFQPAPNSAIGKRLTIDVDARISDMRVTLNGDELPPESIGDTTDPIAMHVVVGVTEKYVASRDGRPLDLMRTYDELSLSTESGEDPESVGEFAELEGKTVRFEWNEGDDAYDKSFHESDGDDALIEDLWDDMDLRALLPERSVSTGDTWQVPGEKLGPVFVPGGLAGSAKGDDGGLAHFKSWLDAHLGDAARAFSVSCKYKGERESDGVQVREIAFTFEGKATLDVADLLGDVIESEEELPEHTIDGSADVALTGEGVLLWDAAAGRMHSFTMKSDASAAVKMDVNFDVDGESYAFATTAKVDAKLTWELETKKP